MVIFSCLYNQFHFCIVQHKPRASVNVSGVEAGMRGFRAGPAAYGNSPFPKPLTIIIKMQNWQSIYDLGIYEDGKKNRSKRRLHAAQELQECRRPPGFDGVPVVLLGAACIAFFKLLSGQGGPKYYVTEVSSYLGNFHIMKSFHFQDIAIFNNSQ